MQGTIQLPDQSQNKQLLGKNAHMASSLQYLFPDISSDVISLQFFEETDDGFKSCSISSQASSISIRLFSEIPVLLTAQVSAAHGPFLKIFILPEYDDRIKNKIIEPRSIPKEKITSMFQPQTRAHSDVPLGSTDRNQEPGKAPQERRYKLTDVDDLTDSLSSLSIALSTLRKDNKTSMNKHISVSVPRTTSQNAIAQDSLVAQRNKMHAAARKLHHKASIYEARSSMFEEASPRYCYWKKLSDTSRRQAMLLQSLLVGPDSSSDNM